MSIVLERVQFEEKIILHNVMQFYIYEFSEYISSIKLGSNGLYDPFDLDAYWTDSSHHAFFIKVDGELAGFVLVKSTTDHSPNSIAEFFVMKKYKGRGVGKTIAKQIFDRFHGKWRVTQAEKNYPAQAFWRSIIKNYTNGKFTERYDEHRRSVQEFDVLL